MGDPCIEEKYGLNNYNLQPYKFWSWVVFAKAKLKEAWPSDDKS